MKRKAKRVVPNVHKSPRKSVKIAPRNDDGLGTSVPPSLRSATCRIAGDTVRAVVPSDQQDNIIETLRREKLRLISVTPVRVSLEDYFMAQLSPDQPSAAAANGKAAQ